MSSINDLLKKVEALIEGATTAGEKTAAEEAKKRLLKRLQQEEPTVEVKVMLPDMWSKRLFIAICRKHNLRPYRYKGLKHTTVIVKTPQSYINREVWPEFQEYAKILERLVSEVTAQVIDQIYEYKAEEVIDPKRLRS